MTYKCANFEIEKVFFTQLKELKKLNSKISNFSIFDFIIIERSEETHSPVIYFVLSHLPTSALRQLSNK